MATGALTSSLVMAKPAAAPASANVAPTDRSKPPEMSRTVMPTATMALNDSPNTRAFRFAGFRKLGEAKLRKIATNRTTRKMLSSRCSSRRRPNLTPEDGAVTSVLAFVLMRSVSPCWRLQ